MRKQTKIAALVSAAALLAIGASMTSFAAPGWNQNTDGTWEYHDRYDDVVTDTWAKWPGDAKSDYYFGDDGLMAVNQLIEYNEHLYYLGSDGRKVTNQWVSFDNVDGDSFNDIEVSTIYRYFDGKGQAATGNKGDIKKSNTDASLGNGRFIFDENGVMLSGWYDSYNDEGVRSTYYLGEENEGWAATGWTKMEKREGEADYNPDVFDETLVWYYFQSNGVRLESARKYLDDGNGKKAYFAFDATGILQANKWNSIGKASTPESYYGDGGYQKTGWKQAPVNDDGSGDTYWFYLNSKGEAYNRGTNVPTASRGIAMKLDANKGDYGDAATGVAAKVIKNKTYLFANNGAMQTGLYALVGVGCEGSRSTLNGYYYFDETGAMVKNKKVTITSEDGTAYDYFFDSTGAAATSKIVSGILYDANGMRVNAQDATWEVLVVGEDVVAPIDVDKKSVADIEDGEIIVNANGRVKESGTVTIDGVKYTIKNYKVTEKKDVD